MLYSAQKLLCLKVYLCKGNSLLKVYNKANNEVKVLGNIPSYNGSSAAFNPINTVGPVCTQEQRREGKGEKGTTRTI